MASATDLCCVFNSTHDFTGYVKMTGFEWEDNDIDSDDSGRNDLDPDVDMVRDVMADKRKLKLSFVDMPFSKLHELVVILRAGSDSNHSFSLKYLDPDAGSQVTKYFYCTKRSASVSWKKADGTSMWTVKSVELVEV